MRANVGFNRNFSNRTREKKRKHEFDGQQLSNLSGLPEYQKQVMSDSQYSSIFFYITSVKKGTSAKHCKYYIKKPRFETYSCTNHIHQHTVLTRHNEYHQVFTYVHIVSPTKNDKVNVIKKRVKSNNK